MVDLPPEYISDIVMKAIDEGNMQVLTPIIQHFDRKYSGECLMGNTYCDYVKEVYAEYIKQTTKQ